MPLLDSSRGCDGGDAQRKVEACCLLLQLVLALVEGRKALRLGIHESPEWYCWERLLGALQGTNRLLIRPALDMVGLEGICRAWEVVTQASKD